jgi:hypothetical protein
VWGVEAKKGKNGIDEAKSLRPFSDVKQFKQSLEEQTKYATDPAVDGVQPKAIFVDDDEGRNEGFVASYFPKSTGVHRALASTTSDFYKRHGDSFTPLSTEEVKALFFRTLAPDLDLVVEKTLRMKTQRDSSYEYVFVIKNKGAGVGRFVSAYVGFALLPYGAGLQYYGGERPPLTLLESFWRHRSSTVVACIS